ncbi:hypothetical protein D8674_009218 [Pyrus ussuriensis x Pyrus communis]|uniref:Uncharacterized protein n=1 Tax=Pyrus ussuriensis x Pyrus communis TaxID=2448454 RepID=A0A5N5HVL9_9ROSA|nr:hypothetical protein D8674_009218 [Pyrus ussuriensis x Pyrus communis]
MATTRIGDPKLERDELGFFWGIENLGGKSLSDYYRARHRSQTIPQGNIACPHTSQLKEKVEQENLK